MTTLLLDKEVGEDRLVEVSGAELRYASRVRRLAAGDPVEVRDLAGRRFSARIERSDRRSLALAILEELPCAPAAFPVTVIMAVPKRSIMDDVVRKLGELGVGRLAPVTTARSIVDPGPARIERWRRIAAQTVRQCGRDLPMRVDDPCPLAAAMAQASGTKVMLHNRGERRPLREIAARGMPPPVSLCIGPEGGLTPDEAASGAEYGFEIADMGAMVLRVETAAIAAAAVSILFLGGIHQPS